jgi:hypothetical protein
MVLMRQGLQLGIAVALCACGESEPPTFEPIPEPATGLRDEAHRGEVPLESRIADYYIDATLDAEEHRIDGTVRITWRNRTRRTVKQVPLHLYMNAFRAEDTVWMREARGRHRGQSRDKQAWGYVDVKTVKKLAQGHVEDLELKPGDPVELEWSEDQDPTTMTVDLPSEVGPGQSITLELDFVTQLPRVFARTGYHEDFHFAGQWFPKIGVLEEEAGWQAHTFTLHSEFYADFGNYEVHLDVPEEMVVGASGIRTAEEVVDGRKKLRYDAEMVHDFAWTAYPDYVEHWGEYEGIRIRQLIQPDHVDDAQAHLDAQVFTLKSFEEHYGPYPWSTITIVHVPEGAGGAGGMEYPTLYTTSNILLPSTVPPWLLQERVSGVFTTVHEFGHQYFQGLFASNEYAQPWLDEGMNTTADIIAYHDIYGEDPWIAQLMGHKMTTSDMVRMSIMQSSLLDPVDQDAGAYLNDVGGYGSMVYQKTAAIFLTLRNLVGVEEYNKAIGAYAAAARFRHPKGMQLESIFVEQLGEKVAMVGDGGPGTVYLDVQDFFDQALRDVSECDFAVHRLTNSPLVGSIGWHRDDHGELIETEAPDDFDEGVSKLEDDQVQGTLVVHRKGDFRVPVEVMVEFSDGSRERLVWSGQSRTGVFRWPGKRVRMAVVDPERKLWIESRRLDNVSYARGLKEGDDAPGDGLSDVLSDWSEASVLATLGGVGP